MDAIDRKILAILQREGRISATDLAERVGLSLSPCHRRLRALEEAGVITDYRASVEPSKLGLGFAAIVYATLREGSRENVLAFEKALLGVPEIVQAQRLFGEPDYMLHVVSKDLATFQRLYDDSLLALPHVMRLNSTLVMKSVIPSRPFPI
ncbi:Lrp/AsnC family transcriptional regulator [Bradyrhizobium sp. IC3069]|uniref:DNA-binding Lrp family transcriptional regulator n=1 Tax=Bradyrhizobium yuanmingense TaxID=108015 RepID=A0ABV4GMN5_9BRAD|nr:MULTISPECIES: Lrp/AsnC family transcriptional regulator [Bradyrhizobium]MCA1360904.1 Lrp/AsnC family transcriptional regulator [Bradyrhizobium sp. IC4059]MCA1378816.1 Lrp/AsnC family transcriptional regulator [Bradyrhizobium sp. IC4060]MCA1411940.1 Lrp/AsnC family transcriptional regulator [Bradyrhizobium sp. NBAIM20]MCA1460828.1 Lrp/AsnC family transcriptional regulator [Bradyrhizobium sp. NBAIM18]MCA1486509.1 Lrp/AsnC family transcriptional regulator [Bradyrhizobium sp. IC4061]